MKYKLSIFLTSMLLIFTICFIAYKMNIFEKENKGIIAAKVGSYEISEQDIKNYFKRIPYKKTIFLHNPEYRREVVELLIHEKLILQEAQRLGMDKGEAFIYSIETDWKQTLIKRMIEKVEQTLTSKINVSNAEIDEFYKNMKYKYPLRIFTFKNQKDADEFIKTYKTADVYRPNVINDTGWHEYNYEDINPRYRNILLSNLNKPYNVFDKNQELTYVIDYKDKIKNTKLLALEKIQQDIINIIKKEKYNKAFEDWMDNLQKKTDIQIYEEKLNSISL